MDVSQDGLFVKDIYLGYNSELNLITTDDSKVREVHVHKDFTVRSDSAHKERWRSFVQIPVNDAKLREFIQKNLKNSGKDVVNEKLHAVTSATTILRGGDGDSGVPFDKYFLGTYNRVTKIVDELGVPITGPGIGGWQNGVIWSEPPVQMILRPRQHVISVGKNTIEIVDWKTADLRQRFHVESSASLSFLSTGHGTSILAVNKKRGSCIYHLKEHTKPPRLPGDLLKSIQLEAPFVEKLYDAEKSPSLESALPTDNTYKVKDQDLRNDLSDEMLKMNLKPTSLSPEAVITSDGVPGPPVVPKIPERFLGQGSDQPTSVYTNYSFASSSQYSGGGGYQQPAKQYFNGENENGMYFRRPMYDTRRPHYRHQRPSDDLESLLSGDLNAVDSHRQYQDNPRILAQARPPFRPGFDIRYQQQAPSLMNPMYRSRPNLNPNALRHPIDSRQFSRGAHYPQPRFSGPPHRPTDYRYPVDPRFYSPRAPVPENYHYMPSSGSSALRPRPARPYYHDDESDGQNR